MIETFRGRRLEAMRQKGLANWALSMGRQRLGALTLQEPSAIFAKSDDATPAISHATDRQ